MVAFGHIFGPLLGVEKVTRWINSRFVEICGTGFRVKLYFCLAISDDLFGARFKVGKFHLNSQMWKRLAFCLFPGWNTSFCIITQDKPTPRNTHNKQLWRNWQFPPRESTQFRTIPIPPYRNTIWPTLPKPQIQFRPGKFNHNPPAKATLWQILHKKKEILQLKFH